MNSREKKIFFAGVSVGTQLKGWGAAGSITKLSDIVVRSGTSTFVEVPAEGFGGIGSVTVEGDENLIPAFIKQGVKILGVVGAYAPTPPRLATGRKTITQNGSYTVKPASGYDGMSRVDLTVNVPTELRLQSKTVTPNTTNQYIAPDADTEFNGLSSVLVYGDTDLQPHNIRKGVTIFGVEGSFENTTVIDAVFQNKTVTPGASGQTVTPDRPDYTALSSVYVAGDEDLISSNIRKGVTIFGVPGTYSTDNQYQEKSVTPGATDRIVTADGSYSALAKVKVFGDSNLKPGNIAKGKSIFGVTGTYVSPMTAVTVVPSEDEQLILPATGFEGFSSVVVAPATASGDYNNGFAAGAASRDAEVAALQAQIEALTDEKNEAYDSGYNAGYNEGYAEGYADGKFDVENLRPNLAALATLSGFIDKSVGLGDNFTRDEFRWSISKVVGYTTGFKFNTSDLVKGATYTVSLKYKKTAGTLERIGGHSAAFRMLSWSIDGVEQSTSYVTGVTVPDDNEEHELVYTGVFREDSSDGDNDFYFQPNRRLSTPVSYDVWNVKVELGDTATPWIPAKEDQ